MTISGTLTSRDLEALRLEIARLADRCGFAVTAFSVGTTPERTRR